MNLYKCFDANSCEVLCWERTRRKIKEIEIFMRF